MTLIECFDESALENFAACLLLEADKLILLGDSPHMGTAAQRYRAVLKKRNKRISVELKETGGKDLGEIADLLREVVLSEDKCVIDMNGGDEMTLMAVGAMLAGLDDRQKKKVSVQRFNPETGIVLDCDGDGVVMQCRPAALTVSELISLYGGTVYPSPRQPDEKMTSRDLDALWKYMAQSPTKWNRTLSALAEFEKRSLCVSEGRMEIFLMLDYLRYEIPDFKTKEALVRDLLKELSENGMIRDNSNDDKLEYTYKDPLARYCTEKVGNLLEIKTLLEARAQKENGAPKFQDCQVGVSIDWDGKVNTNRYAPPETRNEIDLILTQGLRPLFISCKNGQIPEEELYKLHTVATRFGGPNVRKMLIVSDPHNISGSLEQRAKDMGIHLVPNAAELDDAGWRNIFRKAMQ